MGVDSTAIITRWLLEPKTRDFDLEDLVLLTAMTGDEFADTKRLNEKHFLPLLKEHGVRLVQVARGGSLVEDGNVIMSDSRETETLHIEGVYKLSDELKAAGTVPTFSHGKRLCTHKSKGRVLDAWQDDNIPGNYRHVMGFNDDEHKRVKRDGSYGGEGRKSEYPLLDWKWGRQKAEDYLREVFGEPWAKSCCTYCPFAGGKKEVLTRFKEFPEEAAEALMIEAMSLAFNPRMTLYSSGSAIKIVGDSGNNQAMSKFKSWIDSVRRWGLYRVRRAYAAPGNAARHLELLDTGYRGLMEAKLRGHAQGHGTEPERDIWLRAVVQERTPDAYPTTEIMYVVAPALVESKRGRGFDKRWEKALHADWERG
jgi:hypothetical protein